MGRVRKAGPVNIPFALDGSQFIRGGFPEPSRGPYARSGPFSPGLMNNSPRSGRVWGGGGAGWCSRRQAFGRGAGAGAALRWRRSVRRRHLYGPLFPDDPHLEKPGWPVSRAIFPCLDNVIVISRFNGSFPVQLIGIRSDGGRAFQKPSEPETGIQAVSDDAGEGGRVSRYDRIRRDENGQDFGLRFRLVITRVGSAGKFQIAPRQQGRQRQDETVLLFAFHRCSGERIRGRASSAS